MRRFSVDRSTRGVNLDVEKMDVIVIEIVNCELYTWVKGVEFSENVRNKNNQLLSTSYKICSTETLLKDELQHGKWGENHG